VLYERGFYFCDRDARDDQARMDAAFLANGYGISIQFNEGDVRRSLAGKEIAATTALIRLH